MYLFKRITDLQDFLDRQRKAGKTIGFAPTMGALHEGHLSLIRSCNSENDLSVCSIFVNPTQFNDPADLAAYPITLETDISLLCKADCSVLFLPGRDEIYPADRDTKLSINLDGLDQPMEGRFRPGHFEGVVQVVNRLLDIVRPDSLYMGQKDFQQLTIIRKMLEQVHREVRLVMCPVVREADGLAMSSRNRRLAPELRKEAALISRTLQEAVSRSKNQSFPQIALWARQQLKRPGFRMEYFEFVDALSLMPVESLEEASAVVICTAVWAGEVRLIDTIFVKGRESFTK